MASTDRQNRLLVAEDWKRIYQTFRNADFKHYDFDTLRRVLIAYIRQNNPEDFNDYIESSEYLALLDLIAFLGQNLAFRIDLNARENFIELAERRESVLRLARMLSYVPKRNVPASGLLKISSVKTTESFVDSNNINLQNQTVLWNDPSNTNWKEQFLKVIGRSLATNESIGKPIKSDVLDNIKTDKYQINYISNNVPVYSFRRTVNGIQTTFEIVAADFESDVIEAVPHNRSPFSFLYRDDGSGASSSNTGFFVMFKQGTFQEADFTISNPIPNQVVSIDAVNINDTDVWLYDLDSDGNLNNLWSKVSSISGNNVIYNSLNKNDRNIYSVFTRIDDRISLIFADGVFGNLPKNNFKLFYRTSKNISYTINPVDFVGLSLEFPYISINNTLETITLTFTLNNIVDNASTSETNTSIKQNAPASYYLQNRLVNGEDYQIGPLVVSQQIIKAKSVSRFASGISRYFDLIDATGKYSKTNLFGNDGIIFRENFVKRTSFTFNSTTDIEGIIYNLIEPILSSTYVKNFYTINFLKIIVDDLEIFWSSVTQNTNLNTGFLVNQTNINLFLGNSTSSILKLINPGTALKFVAPAGMHFTPDGKLASGEANYAGSYTYKWVKINSVQGTGTELGDDGSGAIAINDIIPTGAKLNEIKPIIAKFLTRDVKQEVLQQIFSYRSFGLRFDQNLNIWQIIVDSDLDALGEFSIGKTGDKTGQQLDSSWLIKFTTDGDVYYVDYRSSRYLFESDKELKFYFDAGDKVYDNTTGIIVKDKIKVLSINTKPTTDVEQGLTNFTTDYTWHIVDSYRDESGYVNSKKIEVTFFDADDDGVEDDFDIFEQIVQPDYNLADKIIFQEKITTDNGVVEYIFTSSSKFLIFQNKDSLGPLSLYNDGQIFYYIETDNFEIFDRTTFTKKITTEYKAFVGRSGLKFHYEHAADSSIRIDPSVSNLIDTYVLIENYDKIFREWLRGIRDTEPSPPSSDYLARQYGNAIDEIKSLSDEVIFHSAKYQILFGVKAKPELQARFKVVKNADLSLNNNDVKSRIIQHIETYFALDNWDFGDVFYFSELSAYVMKQMAPDIVAFVIVPVDSSKGFGSFYEVRSEVDEIFINGATVDDIEIIDAITASRLSSVDTIVRSTSRSNTGIQSS